MAKYTYIKTFGVDDKVYMPGDIINVKKMKHAITFSTGPKYKYVDVNSGRLISKRYLKDNFKKGAYKNEIYKRLFKIWFIIGMYELSKYLTNELIVKLQSEDDVDTFNQSDHMHLNMEVSK
ncbi:hypothetical protein RCI18_07665 [Staphylococcus haemolyticus]|uniref:transcriptional activator RinB n=1 Tax=Staphylococcus haemolyticus TaxID=1283 RepID=UPI0027ED6373|nr:hypothetical protein [Staphylococcus haemolyticus]MDQ7224175.1 hypothetical protein [Staphylococcus haemolyticus]